jgi:hypothetical protein
MGYVHAHQGIPTIEGWGSSSYVQNVIEKSKENNHKARKIGQTINQTSIPRLEHDKIQA